MSEVKKYNDFVFAAVKGDYGNDAHQFYQYVVLIEVPKKMFVYIVCETACFKNSVIEC